MHTSSGGGVARGEEAGHRAGAGRESELLGHQLILSIAGVGPRILARVCRVIVVFHSLAQSADTVGAGLLGSESQDLSEERRWFVRSRPQAAGGGAVLKRAFRLLAAFGRPTGRCRSPR